MAGCAAATPAAIPTAAHTVAPPDIATLTPTPAPGPLPSVRLERALQGLSFQRLTNLVQPSDGSGLFFTTEQPGRVWVIPGGLGATQASLFLDITDRVSDIHNEEGLLGLAFDPAYAQNGHLYLYYSAAAPRRNVLARFTRSQADGLQGDPGSELKLLEIPKSFGNHNGGQLAFGPDGYLYVGVGDGGGSGDPFRNGQNLGSLLGKVLRIDVRDAARPAGRDYRIPPDNPFVGLQGAKGEVWAYGLRNPWRFAFDPETGLLWAGDVGQNAWEEVDILMRGGNYGWNVMEGGHCFSPGRGCSTQGLEPPVAEYSHAQGCSVTGGYVYRGKGIPALVGAYVYADYCSGTLWGLRYENGRVVEHAVLAETGLEIASFAQDAEGELYALTQDAGVYRLTP
ncbi:MAG: PQQ-dependent sugar dehydrogenase [Chloroflexi bacterium]|nr:PQQ-dependent sugar dehydrogenase [Chloroflexota bacterium]